MKILRALCCVLATLILLPRAEAATLYGSTAAGATGQLYILDPATGAMIQNVGPLNDSLNVNYPITGLAFHPVTGVLYGSTGNNPATTAARLVTINPASGLVTVIGSYNTPTVATMADLAFDAAGNLYGIGSVGGPQLYSINILTGQATVIGDSGLTSGTTGGGLAINSAGLFYGAPTSTQFGTYNAATGVYTQIADPAKPAGGGAYGALEFDENGILYGLNVGPGSPPPTHLVTINPTTGAVTDLGASLASVDAIAFGPDLVPEPATMTLLAGGIVLGLLVNAWRRK